MKKIILFAAILFSTVSVVKAVEPVAIVATTSKDITTLSVTLNPIQTITVNQKAVNLVYTTKNDYNKGVTEKQPGHLTVYSTGGFSVSVKSAKDVLEEDKTGNSINSNVISVQASSAKDKPLLGPSAVKLSENGSTLFSSVTGGVDLIYNVDYTGANLEQYFDKLFNQGSASVFKTEVTYTITPL